VSSDPFLFIVGCGRSGTTLLRAMCNSHPRLAIPPESHFVVCLAERHSAPRSFDCSAFLDDLYRDERFDLWQLDREQVEQSLARSSSADYADAVRQVFGTWAAVRGKQRYGDKTPVYVLHIERLASLFPEAVFIHLIRDGRDVACSFLELGWAATVEDAALHWRLRVTRGRRAGRKLGPRRYRELRYEDLVDDPEGSLRELCRAIDLAFSPAMLDHTIGVDDVISSTSHPEYHQRLNQPTTATLRDWRRELTADQVGRFELLAGDLLSDLGYERQAPETTLSMRVDVMARWCRWQLHRIRRRVEQTR
jgi:hypothetical protein